MAARRAIVATPAAWLVWGVVVAFFVFLAGVIGSVLVSSFGTRWFDTWLPEEFTTSWYAEAWERFDLGHITGLRHLRVVLRAALLGGAVAAGLLLRLALLALSLALCPGLGHLKSWARSGPET